MSDQQPPQYGQQPMPPPPPAGTAAGPVSGVPGGPPGGAPQPSSQSTGKMLGIVGGVVVAALALAVGIFALTRNDDADSIATDSTDVTIDTALTDTVPPTDPADTTPADSVPADTEPVATDPVETEPAATEPAATEPADTEPADTEPTGTEPPSESVPPITDPEFADEALTTVGSLLAWTSFGEEPMDDALQQSEIARLIDERFVQAVAHPTRVSTICTGIPVDVALDLSIVWEYGGQTLQVDERSAVPPGTGSCVSNDGEPLGAGSYQVYPMSVDGSEIGYVTTFVVGANQVSQTFVNNSDSDVCDIGVAPTDTAFYEFFVSDQGAIAPGEFIEITVATVEQDLLARFCDGSEAGAVTFIPNGGADQNLAP